MPTPPEPKRVAPKLETKTVSGLTGVKAVPHVYGHQLTYAGLPTVHHLGKREAEAEADPYDPYYGYTGYPYTYYTYGYPLVKAVPHVYGHPLTYTYTGGRYGKREAEANLDE